MKLKKVYLMCGTPGSGKSTWIQQQMKNEPGLWCSRDKVRFSLVSENEEYFSKEDEVFDTWIGYINNGIKSVFYNVIYIDATHLSQKSRNKTLDKLNLTDVDIIPVVFNISLDTCLQRNNLRNGRERVPESAVRNMYKTFINSPITFNEKYKYTEIITITE